MELTTVSQSPFDSIRKFNDDGSEFWSARDLMPMMGYPRWSDFKDSVDRAKSACKNTGNVVAEHFSGTILINPNSNSGRNQCDTNLSRYGSYLVAMNGDPRKPEVAIAQSYFAMRTHEAETKQLNMFDDLVMLKETNKNLELQIRLKEIDLETLKIERGFIIAPFTATPQRTTMLSKRPVATKDGTVDLNKIVERFRGQIITARDLIRIRACKTAYEGEQIIHKLAELGLGMIGRTAKYKPQLEIAAL